MEKRRQGDTSTSRIEHLAERSLANPLIGIRKDPKFIEHLKQYDEMELLEVKQKK